MANAEQVKTTVALVLEGVEKLTRFASDTFPMLGIVSTLVGVLRRGVQATQERSHPCDRDFQAIHSQLASISEQNHECLRQIRVNEVNETFGRYEQYIRHQYGAFNNMVEAMKRDPENAQDHMEEYAKIYELDKSDLSIDVFYNGVMGNALFGSRRPLLEVYLEHCERDLKTMQHRCYHLLHLFQIGLMAHIAYIEVTDDDVEGFKEKWLQWVEEIQTKMQEVLSQCNDDSSTSS